ncbi:MAG: hypothetical protein PVI30_08410 [Myxococcales bacterium]|jgi:hypothetical protein
MPARISIFAFVALACVACQPEIGDECGTALDCSAQGSRLCDRTQPGGYCTIEGCERGTCPEEAVCVKFRPNVERIAVTYCMYECESDGDCRDGSGYACLRGDQFGDGTEAEVLGGPRRRFCGIDTRLPDSATGPDASAPMSVHDGGATDEDAGAIGESSESNPDETASP